MRLFIRFMVLILLVVLNSTCSPDHRQKNVESAIPDIDWIQGSWYRNEDGITEVESWQKQNDSVYFAQCYTVKDKDTSLTESISLEKRNGKLFYIPTIVDQNEGLPIEFKMTGGTDSTLIFENPQHDFPQLIKYSRINNDSLVAEISGKKGELTKSFSFPMKRR